MCFAILSSAKKRIKQHNKARHSKNRSNKNTINNNKINNKKENKMLLRGAMIHFALSKTALN